jgi:hypothetical protein
LSERIKTRALELKVCRADLPHADFTAFCDQFDDSRGNASTPPICTIK